MAKIFNIQRFCLHDGPGIRTTVFFMYCPLHCAWCHNPECNKWDFGQDITTSEILGVVLKDKKYYDNSGGGITVSGGEPLAQFDSLLDLLISAKEKGLHTTIETCGFAETRHFSALLPYVDLFLYDYKETDGEKHKEFTGQDNELILQNLDFLYENGAEIQLRCPIIPGYNDSAEHFAAIDAMREKYPRMPEPEQLPYHNLGEGKKFM